MVMKQLPDSLEKVDILNCISNGYLNRNLWNEVEIVFSRKRRDNKQDVVIAVSREIRDILIDEKSVMIGWCSFKIADFILVTQ